MIYLDDRIGSIDLFPLFEEGLRIKVTRMQFGDIYFIGKGPDECPVLVGFERKTIGDLINSMNTGRLAGHQLPGLVNSYNIPHLIVEGYWRRGQDGHIEVPNGGSWKPLKIGYRYYMMRDVNKFIYTQIINRKIIYLTTTRPEETASLTTDIYKWWTGKDFESHRSHEVNYDPFIHIIASKQTPVERAAEAIGHGLKVGGKKAHVIAKHFPTVFDMCLATEEDWRSIKGIGRVLAKRMYDEIHREDDNGKEAKK